MLASVFGKTLRDRRRAIWVWSLSLFATMVLLMWFYPSIQGTVDLETYLQALPPALRATFMGNFTSIATPEGYLNIELFAMFLPFLVSALTVGVGAAAVSGEEERGTLDLLLATALSRQRLVWAKFAALVVELALVSAVTWLGLVLGARWVNMNIAPLAIAGAMIACSLFALFMGALALALGCLGAGRGASVGIASVIGVAAYLLHGGGTVVQALKPWQKLSPYNWYLGDDPLLNGLDVRYALQLVAASLLLVAVGMLALQRRDVGV